MVKIGIIGCGAIGSSIAKAIQNKFQRFAKLAYISDNSWEQIARFEKNIRDPHVSVVSVDELIRKSDFIIETASQEAVKTIIPKVLARHKNILALSVGGILQISNLRSLLDKSRGQIFIPSGGIAGVDALLASRQSDVREVRITTRKPIRGLRGAPYFAREKGMLEKIKKPTLVFEGTAKEAIRCFPQNINVAATLSLAGLGPRKTKVRIYTSPTYRYNSHEIEIHGAFGRIITKVTNLPSEENPKTSMLAIGSTIATLEKIFSRLKVGT